MKASTSTNTDVSSGPVFTVQHIDSDCPLITHCPPRYLQVFVFLCETQLITNWSKTWVERQYQSCSPWRSPVSCPLFSEWTRRHPYLVFFFLTFSQMLINSILFSSLIVGTKRLYPFLLHIDNWGWPLNTININRRQLNADSTHRYFPPKCLLSQYTVLQCKILFPNKTKK